MCADLQRIRARDGLIAVICNCATRRAAESQKAPRFGSGFRLSRGPNDDQSWIPTRSYDMRLRPRAPLKLKASLLADFSLSKRYFRIFHQGHRYLRQVLCRICSSTSTLEVIQVEMRHATASALPLVLKRAQVSRVLLRHTDTSKH